MKSSGHVSTFFSDSEHEGDFTLQEGRRKLHRRRARPVAESITTSASVHGPLEKAEVCTGGDAKESAIQAGCVRSVRVVPGEVDSVWPPTSSCASPRRNLEVSSYGQRTPPRSVSPRRNDD